MIKHIEKELRNVLTVQQGSTARVKGMTIQQMTVQLVFIVSIELTTALLMMVSQALFAPKGEAHFGIKLLKVCSL